MEFESASSGSSKASLCAALIQESLPTTGVAIHYFLPTSSSLSTQITSSFDAAVDSISLSNLLFVDMYTSNYKITF